MHEVKVYDTAREN